MGFRNKNDKKMSIIAGLIKEYHLNEKEARLVILFSQYGFTWYKLEANDIVTRKEFEEYIGKMVFGVKMDVVSVAMEKNCNYLEEQALKIGFTCDGFVHGVNGILTTMFEEIK